MTDESTNDTVARTDLLPGGSTKFRVEALSGDLLQITKVHNDAQTCATNVVAQTCATNEVQRMSKSGDDRLQALASTVSEQHHAMRQQAERWNQAEEREEKRNSQMTARFDTLAASLEAQTYKLTKAFVVVSKAVTKLGAEAEASRDLILKLSTQ